MQKARTTYFASSTLAKAVLANKVASPKLFIAESKLSAAKLAQSLQALGENVVIFDSPPAALLGSSGESEMIKKTNMIYFGVQPCVVMTCDALATHFISLKLARQNHFKIEKGQTLPIENLVKHLVLAGFSPQSAAQEANSFCCRGDVVDINVRELGALFRIYFFGDIVEQIYTLDLLSFKRLEEVFNLEFSALKNAFELSACDKSKFFTSALTPNARRTLGENLQKAERAGADPFLFAFDKDAFLNASEVFAGYNILVENPSGIKMYLKERAKENETEFNSLLSIGQITAAHRPLFVSDIDAFFASAEANENSNLIAFHSPLASNPFWNGGEYKKVEERVLSSFGGMAAAKKEVDANAGKNITLFVKNNYIKDNLPPMNATIKIGDFGGGVVVDGEAVFTLKQDTGSLRGSRNVADKFAPKQGDYVVHAFHGIGLCHGLQRREVAGEEKDFFAIEYAGKAMLLVPCENADSLSRFSGGEEMPKLSVIGGKDFENAKAKVRASLKKVAFNLALLFKERITKVGYRFNDDDELQKEFEALFPYEETQGQLAAIADIKKDMQSTKIMDRLICGDVGFGKTEVAFRAAYKAVLSGKQVLFLAPTTILSYQHYNSAKQRFIQSGANLGLLNRFVSAKEQKNVAEGLKNGTINVVFGTHKLLSENLEFFDLGLLIIDEEQRFGTAQKEKLKNMKKTLDVLTLSATPIPRTLHLSLIKVRDVSIIDTPPKGRTAPIVYVCEFNMELLRTAIEKECQRGGQAFVIFNNIEKLGAFAASLKSILPSDTIIDAAHARLPAKELESKVEKLYSGQTQVFISTTIVENGLDIKNANTIIVVDAQRFGLADLYQLKGRVGRTSDVQAYAYFMHKGGELSEQSEKRLAAIADFSSLGDGFEIAMKDLQIRGSGNVFGAEQSGHLNKVGYVEFAKIVDEVVAEALGETRAQSKNDAVLDVKLACFISEHFEKNASKRIELYKFLQAIDTEEMLENMLTRLENEYGALPKELVNLANIVLLKNRANKFGAKKIKIDEENCIITLDKERFEVTASLNKKLSKFSGVLKLDGVPIICLSERNRSSLHVPEREQNIPGIICLSERNRSSLHVPEREQNIPAIISLAVKQTVLESVKNTAKFLSI